MKGFGFKLSFFNNQIEELREQLCIKQDKTNHLKMILKSFGNFINRFILMMNEI